VTTSKTHVYAVRIVKYFGQSWFFIETFDPVLGGTHLKKVLIIKSLPSCSLQGWFAYNLNAYRHRLQLVPVNGNPWACQQE